ncbi:M20 metallopeptidase family protein [Adhaeretor mobilis]|uniref:Putative hydrolase YxeP n=1 Tax=Adhaeretor mobilis TaxID=1930276 RepID=A0A517MTW7_9BACT|nr:amidohydrolase [Adhaeretor mobilis]QDS98329.1 putative hydrolase YxeP [Adhaeretor mobilis]
MPDHWQQELHQHVEDIADELVELRRHFHAHPEPSGEEFDTSLLLYQRLSELGLTVAMGPEGCGVVADNSSPAPGSARIAVRGDIDALRIHDEKTAPYRSQNDGIMHACGHDAHATMAYGVAAVLSRLEKAGQVPWPLAWRAILQPAEETATGAKAMVAAGVMDNVAAIFALHVDPKRLAGVVGIRKGALTASCDAIKFTVIGQGGHGARPHESKDPIAATALLVSSLYQFVPRANDSLDGTVLSIGRIAGGENANVIPEQVEVEGTLRTLDAQVRAKSIDHIRQVLRGVEEITETRIEMEIPADTPAVLNDQTATELLRKAAIHTLGSKQVEKIPRPSMGSEDFAVYLEESPGAMFRLGVAKPGTEHTLLHTSLFDIDESALAHGVEILAHAIVLACSPECEFQSR